MIHLRIITPQKIVFEGDVASITALAAEGEVTILPKHADLFSLLSEGVVTVRKDNKEDHLAIGGGFLETNGEEINLLVSRAYGQQEVDEKLVDKALKDAEKLVSEAKTEQERHNAMAQFRRTIIDQKLLRKARRRQV